jgi:hypothetical protein
MSSGLGKAGGIACAHAIGLALALAVADPAAAQVPGEEVARRSFEEGVALEKKGDFGAALAKFKESSSIKATLGNRYHLAYCLEMTGKLAAALTEYEALAQAAHDQKKNDVAEATRLRLEPLRPRVPELSVTVPADVAGVDVRLDDAPLAAVLLEGRSFRVDPGAHTVSAHAPERQPFQKTLELAEGSTSRVDVTLPSLTKPAPAEGGHATGARRAAPAPSRHWPSSRALAIVATGGAAGFATLGFVSFVAAGTAQHEAQTSCPEKTSCGSEQSRIRTLDAFALVGFLGASALAATAIVLWTAKPRPRTDVAVRGSWIGLEGSF